jgi:hypothetical protein
MAPAVGREVSQLAPRSGAAPVVVLEVPAGQGIADVVAVRFDTGALRQRLDAMVDPICSPLRIRTLLALRTDRFMRVETLARKVHASPGGLARSTLRPLAENGLVELSGGRARSTGRWRPVDGHVTAVELKLSKWRSALRQADNIAFAADRSWVVLDSARARKAVAAADHFRAFGVGLAVVGPGSPLRVVVRPAGRRPERWLRALMAECAWQRAESDALAHLGVF